MASCLSFVPSFGIWKILDTSRSQCDVLNRVARYKQLAM